MEDFSLFIKQCYFIVRSAEKIWKVKSQVLKKNKNGRILLISNRAVYGTRNSRFITEQEGGGFF